MDLNPFTKLEIRDLFYLISLLISAISLFISGYWNSLRGAKFMTIAPRFIIYIYAVEKQDFLILPITIANIGAQIGVVDSLYLRITKSAYNNGSDYCYKNDSTFYAISDGEGLEEFFKHIPLTILRTKFEQILRLKSLFCRGQDLFFQVRGRANFEKIARSLNHKL